MTDGFRVDLAATALKDAEDGASGTLDQLRTRAVSDIDCPKAAVGHDRLADTLTDFCDRWSLGVDKLVKDVEEVAGRLTEDEPLSSSGSGM